MFIFGLILGLSIGIFLGYKLARWLNKKTQDENEFLKDQINTLKENTDYWAMQANGRNLSNHEIIQNHNLNLGNTISTVVQLLQAMQQQPETYLTQDEKRKVENIIQQAKGITSYHE